MVPLSYSLFPLPSDYERHVDCVFTHAKNGVWGLFGDRPKDIPSGASAKPHFHAICHVDVNGTVTPVFRHEGLTDSAFAASQDGSVLAYAESAKDSHLIRVVRPTEKKIVREIDSHELGLRWTSSMALDANGKTLFVSGRGDDGLGYLIQYDWETGKWKRVLSGKRLYDVTVTGASCVSVYLDGKYVVIDIATGKILHTITGNRLNYLHATSDGRYVIIQCN